MAWSLDPDRSWNYTNRTFVYLAFACLGALLGEQPRRLLYGLSVLLGVVCIWALLGKVLPWLYEDYGRVARLRAPSVTGTGSRCSATSPCRSASASRRSGVRRGRCSCSAGWS